MASPVRVIVTANSALAVAQIKNDLAFDGSLQVSTASSIDQLRAQLVSDRPQVVLLDTQLSGNNTVQLVAELSSRHKVPVVLRTDSALNLQPLLLDAINAGAMAVLEKPASSESFALHLPSLIWSIKASAAAIPGHRVVEQFLPLGSTSATALLAIGGGMGSLPTLDGILSQLPANCPGAIVIPPVSGVIAELWVSRLNRPGRAQVKLARDGDRIQSGQVLVAQGDSHLLVRRTTQGLVVNLKNGPAVFHQKPSIDLMFDSLAQIPGADAVGVLLGGAGVAGVSGLMNLKNAGGRTIAESATTCVLGDAPGRAIKCGAVDAVETAGQIAAKMLEFATRNSLRAA